MMMTRFIIQVQFASGNEWYTVQYAYDFDTYEEAWQYLYNAANTRELASSKPFTISPNSNVKFEWRDVVCARIERTFEFV